jgi:hypothetical protein
MGNGSHWYLWDGRRLENLIEIFTDSRRILSCADLLITHEVISGLHEGWYQAQRAKKGLT